MKEIMLELRHEMRDKAGLPPPPPTARPPLRARCFRQSSTRISAAPAKATTAMRVTGTPGLRALTCLSHVDLARICRGPAAALPRRPPLRHHSNPSGPSTGQPPAFAPFTPCSPPPSHSARVACRFRLIWSGLVIRVSVCITRGRCPAAAATAAGGVQPQRLRPRLARCSQGKRPWERGQARPYAADGKGLRVPPPRADARLRVRRGAPPPHTHRGRGATRSGRARPPDAVGLAHPPRLTTRDARVIDC